MRNAILLIAALALSSCASIVNRQTCEQAATGLNTVDQLAQVFINMGEEEARARKVAAAVLLGQELLAVACAKVSPNPIVP